jgi:transposase-like protein
MSTTLPKPRQLQRIAALAHLDAEELRIEIENEQATINVASAPALTLAEFSARLDSLARLTDRLLQTLNVPIGVTVEQAAERLDVTTPTVRKWLKEGLLRRVEGRKPVEVDPRSLIELQRVLATVRVSFPARQWSKALAAYLHDRDLQGQAWFANGRDEFERGEFVER